MSAVSNNLWSVSDDMKLSIADGCNKTASTNGSETFKKLPLTMCLQITKSTVRPSLLMSTMTWGYVLVHHSYLPWILCRHLQMLPKSMLRLLRNGVLDVGLQWTESTFLNRQIPYRSPGMIYMGKVKPVLCREIYQEHPRSPDKTVMSFIYIYDLLWC